MELTSQQKMTDSAIVAMHKFLSSKSEKQLNSNTHAAEMYHITNTDSLNFFEVMFHADLERLGLI